MSDIPRTPNSAEHTPGHIDCQACAGLRAMPYATIDPTTLFPQAYAAWLAARTPEIRPNTFRSYSIAAKPLCAFFGQLALNEIHIGHVRAYQAERGKTAGHYLLNNECSCLAMVLKEADLWADIKPKYKPRTVPKRGSGHSLSAAEEQRLRDVAFRHPKWRLAAHCMIVMLSTTMNWSEISHLRRRHVNLHSRKISVIEGKNDGRDRDIPLNHAALASMEWLVERWEKLGGSDPEQFLLPKRPRHIGGPWVFDEPITSIKTAFGKIRKEAGLPHFRIHDCRVQAITKLLSNPKVSRQVAKEIAGHISQDMQDRYSIQQFDTKLDALEALEAPDSTGPIVMPKRPVEIEKKPPKQAAEVDLAQQFAEFLRWKQFSA